MAQDDADSALPPGWTKHWSNSWQKHYWFNTKTGKQSWEHPGAAGAEQEQGAQAAHAAAGDKRKAPEPAAAGDAATSKAAHHGRAGAGGGEGGAAAKPASPAGGAAVKPASPAKKTAAPPAGAGGALASLLGSIASSIPAPTAKELEKRKKRKEEEEARRVEEKAERENYKNWIAFQLDSFAQEGRAFLELPPCDSVHRIIAKDEAEERGFVAISHGEKEEDKRVYVFPDGKGPNQLESNYLRLGGSVQELVDRRARGDDFKEYCTTFDLSCAKLVSKTRGKNTVQEEYDGEEAIESRKVNNRDLDASQAKALAEELRTARQEQAQAFLEGD